MKYLSRILMFLAPTLLVALFIWPMWRIELYAPQYPDGVKMFIYINKIGGNSPGTLQNVNILNHYVGMKKIEPDAIPELKYFPFVIGAMILLGLGAALSNRPGLFLAWTLLMVVLAILGMYDFYLWEYDYGHNLSPTAPIKIPDASFQPPLIGKKMILNFEAVSLPHTAGYFAMASILLGGVAWWLRRK